MSAAPANDLAEVVSVDVGGDAGAYRFNVTVRNPDEGCAF